MNLYQHIHKYGVKTIYGVPSTVPKSMPTLVRGTNVFEYNVYSGRRYHNENDLPGIETCIAPPWGEFFIETDATAHYHHFFPDAPEQAFPNSYVIGTRFIANDVFDMDDDEWESILDIQRKNGAEFPTDTRWIISVHSYFSHNGRAVELPIHGLICLTKDGFIGTREDGTFAVAVVSGEQEALALRSMVHEVGVTSDDAVQLFVSTTVPAMWVLESLHYRGMKVEQEAVSKRDAKRAEKRGWPVFKYHTLKLAVMDEVVSYVKKEISAGREVSMHTVRGHKVTYTPDAPLFGRHVGTFFRRPHARGDKEVGYISKDYEPLVD